MGMGWLNKASSREACYDHPRFMLSDQYKWRGSHSLHPQAPQWTHGRDFDSGSCLWNVLVRRTGAWCFSYRCSDSVTTDRRKYFVAYKLLCWVSGACRYRHDYIDIYSRADTMALRTVAKYGKIFSCAAWHGLRNKGTEQYSLRVV